MSSFDHTSDCHPQGTSSTTSTAIANLPIVKQVCEMMSERMLGLEAIATGLEFNLNSDGERDTWSELQIIKFVVRPEYRKHFTKKQILDGAFEQDIKGIADLDVEGATDEGVWWDDLIVFSEVREADEWATWACSVDPAKAQRVMEYLAMRPVVTQAQREADIAEILIG